MREERLLQIFGLILAVLFIASAAFAVGVVVGRSGRLDWRPEIALGRGGMPGVPPPPPDGQGAPSGAVPPDGRPLSRPQVVGRIQQISAETLTLVTRQGPRTVTLSPATRYRAQDGTLLERTDLHVGDVVAVWGALSTLGDGSLHAETVVRLRGAR